MTSINRKIIDFCSIALLLVINWFIILVGNGTSSVLPFLYFIPITYSAWKFGMKGGLIAGLLSGLLCMGPFMPLNVAEQIAQPTFNWMMRLIFYSVYGYGMGNAIVQLKEKSGYDSLMGIRIEDIYDYLTKELQKENEVNNPFYIVLINIDDFKNK
ncbi:hypothetical protein KHA80_03215 [Anaerobacillus sp. HL2]|nr:hypothetical protein KHA80_03215 [Anaerobacillus sp. HL2]